MENSPPHTKRAPPQTFELAKFWKKNRPEFWRRPFFFFYHLILGGKNVWISDLSETFRLKFRTNRLKLIQGQWKFWISINQSILDFGRKITLNFGEDLFFFFFFFLRSPNFRRKKRLNFRSFGDISSQISDKPSETDSRSMKIRVKVVCTLLTLSK